MESPRVAPAVSLRNVLLFIDVVSVQHKPLSDTNHNSRTRILTLREFGLQSRSIDRQQFILAQGTFRSPYVVPALACFHGATG